MGGRSASRCLLLAVHALGCYSDMHPAPPACCHGPPFASCPLPSPSSKVKAALASQKRPSFLGRPAKQLLPAGGEGQAVVWVGWDGLTVGK